MFCNHLQPPGYNNNRCVERERKRERKFDPGQLGREPLLPSLFFPSSLTHSPALSQTLPHLKTIGAPLASASLPILFSGPVTSDRFLFFFAFIVTSSCRIQYIMAAQEYYGSSPEFDSYASQTRAMAPYRTRTGGVPPPTPGTPAYYGERQLPSYGQSAPDYYSSEFPPEKVS